MPEQLLDQLNTNKDMQIDLQELQKAFANKFFENKNNRAQLSYELNQGIDSLLEESFCRALTTAYLDAKKRIGKEQEKSVIMLGSPTDRAILDLFHELSKYNNQLRHLQQELEQKKVATDTQYKELQEGKVGTEKWMDSQVRTFEAHRHFTRGTYEQKKALLISACKTTDLDSRLTPVQKEHLKERYLLTLMTKKNGELTLFGIKDRVQKQRVSYEQLTKQLHTAQQQFEADCSPEDINAIALYQNASGEELKFRPVLTEKQRNLMHQLNAMQQQEHQLDAVQQYFSHIMQLPDSDQGTPWKNFQAGRERQIPFVSGIMEVGKLIDIYQIAKKQQAGGQLSATEQLLFQSFASLEQARTAVAQMKITGYDVGAGASSTVNFLVELGLTGGMIGLGRKAAVEGSKKIVKQMVKKETRKAALEAVKKGTKEAVKIGFKMTSTIQAHNTARNVMEELVADYGLKLDPDGEVNITEYGPGASIIKGLIKGVAKSFITNTSEQIGGPIVNELFGYLPKSVMSNWIINVLQTGQMKKILQDGFVGESLEEFISQGLTGVHDVARGDQKLSDIYSLHGAKVTVLTCMLVSGGVQGLNITNNTLRFTDNGQTKIIDLGTHENITELTPGQEQKTESYIKQKWQEALVENKALVTNIKQQLNIIRQDYASEVRKQNSPEGIRSRQNFQEFWKNMSKLGITGIATRIPPLAFIPGSQVAILYMSQNQKNIKKFLGLTFHALDEIEKANVEKKQIQTQTPKTPDQTTNETSKTQQTIAEVNQDIDAFEENLSNDLKLVIDKVQSQLQQKTTQRESKKQESGTTIEQRKDLDKNIQSLTKAYNTIKGIQDGSVHMEAYAGVREVAKSFGLDIESEQLILIKQIVINEIKLRRNTADAKKPVTQRDVNMFIEHELGKDALLEDIFGEQGKTTLYKENIDVVAQIDTILQQFENVGGELLTLQDIEQLKSFTKQFIEALRSAHQDLSSQQVFNLTQENIRKLVFQNIADKGLLSGSDHGILHIVQGDIFTAWKTIDQLQSSGHINATVSQKLKVYVGQMIVDHDIGYNMESFGSMLQFDIINGQFDKSSFFQAVKDHPLYSRLYVESQTTTYEEYFGKEITKSMQVAMLDHSDVHSMDFITPLAQLAENPNNIQALQEVLQKLISSADCMGVTATDKTHRLFSKHPNMMILLERFASMTKRFAGDAKTLTELHNETKQLMFEEISRMQSTGEINEVTAAYYHNAIEKGMDISKQNKDGKGENPNEFPLAFNFSSFIYENKGLTIDKQGKSAINIEVNQGMYNTVSDTHGQKIAINNLLKIIKDFGKTISLVTSSGVTIEILSSGNRDQQIISLCNTYIMQGESFTLMQELPDKSQITFVVNVSKETTEHTILLDKVKSVERHEKDTNIILQSINEIYTRDPDSVGRNELQIQIAGLISTVYPIHTPRNTIFKNKMNEIDEKGKTHSEKFVLTKQLFIEIIGDSYNIHAGITNEMTGTNTIGNWLLADIGTQNHQESKKMPNKNTIPAENVDNLQGEMKQFDEAIKNDDPKQITKLLDIALQKGKDIAGFITSNQIVKVFGIIDYAKHIIESIGHAKENVRHILSTQTDLNDKFANFLSLLGSGLSVLIHGTHLTHVITHPTPEGIYTLQKYGSEVTVIDIVSASLKSMAKTIHLRTTQKKVYEVLISQKHDIFRLIAEAKSPSVRKALVEGLKNKLNILGVTQDISSLINTIGDKLINDPNKENMELFFVGISYLKPPNIRDVNELLRISNYLASTDYQKAIGKYETVVDGI